MLVRAATTSLAALSVSSARMPVPVMEALAAIRRLQPANGSNIVIVRLVGDLPLGDDGGGDQAAPGLRGGTGSHRHGDPGGAIEDDKAVFGAGDAGRGLRLWQSEVVGHGKGLVAMEGEGSSAGAWMYR